MANVPSAQKRNRQRLRRRQRNLTHKTKVRTIVKRASAALEDKEPKSAEALKAAITALDKAAQKGVIKRKTASRKISRLTRRAQAARPA